MIKATTTMAFTMMILMMLGTGLSAIQAAEGEAAANSFVFLKSEGICDQNNTHLWLENNHKFKTVATKVRWRAHGGKDRVEEFYPMPNSNREIGCAAEGEILEAKFVDF